MDAGQTDVMTDRHERLKAGFRDKQCLSMSKNYRQMVNSP